eukprot:2385224-Rhodomonas_salina.3
MSTPFALNASTFFEYDGTCAFSQTPVNAPGTENRTICGLMSLSTRRTWTNEALGANATLGVRRLPSCQRICARIRGAGSRPQRPHPTTWQARAPPPLGCESLRWQRAHRLAVTIVFEAADGFTYWGLKPGVR